MQIDPIITDTTISILGTLSVTLFGFLKWFHGSMRSFNQRIDALAKSIYALDKSLAIQSTILDQALKKGTI
jgi:hypothetical protein